MQKDFSYGIIPVFRNKNGEFEFLLIYQKSFGWAFWWFPKGHAEKKETWVQAAQRELQEEVGIKDISIKKEPQWSFSYQFWQQWIQYDKTVQYWIGFVKDTTTIIQEEELEDCAWFSFLEAREKISHDSMRKVLDEVAEFLCIPSCISR